MQPNTFTLFKDLNKFIRDLTVQRYFSIQSSKQVSDNTYQTPHPTDHDILDETDQPALAQLEELYAENFNADLEWLTQHCPTSPPVRHTTLRPKSIFNPTNNKGPYLQTFYQVVYSDFIKMCNTNREHIYIKSNLSPLERQALEQLTLNQSIVIKPADKGGSIVIQEKDDYVRESRRLLSDTNTYSILSSDPTSQFALEVATLVNRALTEKIISKSEASFITKNFYKVPYFYHLPKIHKDLTNPPGRPIVAAMDSVTSGFSIYIDQFLQPLAQNLPSYIRDGPHLLDMLKPYTWEQNYWWLSLDVSSLYTSIPHDVGVRAVEHFLANDPLTNPRQANFILEALTFCLKHNYFESEGTHYLQINGTAMGANFAPSYANLTMGYWEHMYLAADHPHAAHVIYYGRYIDDIVIIWDGTFDDIMTFVQYCNHNSLGLSFTHVADPDTLAFLDLELCHDNKTIYARNFTKPTAGNSFIHYDSCHHPRWVNNIPRSQFCRLRRNCTRDSDYDTHGQLLSKKFLDKGYPTPLIDAAFHHYRSLSPGPNRPPTTGKQPTRFITQFHDKYKKMEKILASHWPILLEDPHLRTTVDTKPKVAYRKSRNIKSKIAPSRIKPTQPTSSPLTLIPLRGMYQCKKPLCLTCQFIQHGQKTFTVKGKNYTLKEFYNCSTDFVIYCLTCPCGLIYVGRTIRALRARFGEHRRFIEKGRDHHSVPKHFLTHHGRSTAGLSVWVIESIPAKYPAAERYKRLCQQETYWIYSLGTLAPGGLNEDIEVHTLL